MQVERYRSQREPLWNEFARRSKNGTFLFHRSYMEYHADRFEDFSLIVRDEADHVVALLPATRHADTVVSHGGLTYGGFVSGPQMTVTRMLNVFAACLDHLRRAGIASVVYKCVPHLYHSIPAEEDAYTLFRCRATLSRREVSSAIDTALAVPFRRGRLSELRAARKNGLRVEETTAFADFWAVLEQNLSERHDSRPVHNLREIEHLARLFPENIRLFRCLRGEVTLAGSVVYLSTRVCHVQYDGASEEGRGCGAQGLVLATVIEHFSRTHRWIDMGISTEQGGQHLNEGLMAFKEGFGARSVNYDTYELVL
jgi:Acetyltransferase (GNAT) domain